MDKRLILVIQPTIHALQAKDQSLRETAKVCLAELEL